MKVHVSFTVDVDWASRIGEELVRPDSIDLGGPLARGIETCVAEAVCDMVNTGRYKAAGHNLIGRNLISILCDSEIAAKLVEV